MPNAAISISKTNITDFLKAKGVGVPISLQQSSVKAFATEVFKDDLPRGTLAILLRKGADAVVG